MNKWLLMLGICFTLFRGSAAWAETMVLISGFQAQGMDWRFRHVSDALQTRGWVDGGNLQLTAQGVSYAKPLQRQANKLFYTLDLPSSAPIDYQAKVLGKYLSVIAAQRREPLHLVGHSAGGVVARYWLVTDSARSTSKISTLITIASPHLGTPLADLSGALVNTPLGEMAEQLGFKGLRQAEDLYSDLREEKPGTFLYWLNHQPHPAIRYVSVIRNSTDPDHADLVVPPYSQDMNYVFSLRGHSEVWPTPTIGHFLTAQDGYLLAHILSGVRADLEEAK